MKHSFLTFLLLAACDRLQAAEPDPAPDAGQSSASDAFWCDEAGRCATESSACEGECTPRDSAACFRRVRRGAPEAEVTCVDSFEACLSTRQEALAKSSDDVLAVEGCMTTTGEVDLGTDILVPSSDSEDPPASPEPATEDAASPPEATAGSSWVYSTNEDEMTGAKVRLAMVESSNVEELHAPYAGGTRATLVLRRHPRSGLNVIVSVTQGQIICHSFMRCRVNVRFDDDPPIRLRGVESASGDSTTIFLEPAAKMVARTKKARDVAVELELYRDGNRVFHFPTAGLEGW